MKRFSFLLLFGLISLSVSSPVLAHGQGAYGGYGPSASVSIWGDSYGQYGYAGSLNYGYGSGWIAPSYQGHVHGPACGNAPRHGGFYGKGYRHGYKHGRKHGHHRRERGHKRHHH